MVSFIMHFDPVFRVIDAPQDVVNAIFDYYGHSGFEPTEQQREQLLEL